MAIFRGVGGSGDSSDNSFLDAVTAQANSASASATSAANSLAAIQQTEVTSASFDTGNGVLTLTKTGGATVTADLDGRFLTSYTETNNLTTAVTWANVPDANITESSVTQYLTAANVTSPLTGGTGISVASNGTITNDSPDQTVALTGAGGTSVTGTYPNFTITSSSTLTDAQIKTAYENNADTNAFTDAEKTKLSNIEASADVTDATNVTAAGALMDGDFTSNGFMKRTGTGAYSVDTSTYLTSFDITTQTDPKYLRADADDTTTGTITADGGYNTNNGSFATVTGSITSSYGGITVGGLVTAPNLNISKSGSVTTNIATGAISTPGDTKTLNLGTGFSSQGTTTVNIGSFPTTINLNGNVAVSGTVDGRNVATDGTRLDTIPYHRVRYEKLRYNNASVTLTTTYKNISQTPEIYSPTTSVKCSRYIDFQTEIEWEYISSTNNDLNFKLEVTVPTSSATVTTLGTVTAGNFSGYEVSGFEGWFYVSGDFTHHLTAFGRMNKTGVSNATEVPARAWHYDPINDRTYILTDSNPGYSVSTGDTMYWHPYAWESAGTTLFVEDTLSERYVGSGSRQNITLRFKTAYDDNQLKYKAYLRELSTSDRAVIRGGEATLTEIEEV